MQLFRLTIFAVFCVFAVSGCRQQTPVRSYVTELDHEEEIVTSEVLRRSMSIPFDWSAPGEWRRAANDQFSTVAWELDSDAKVIPRITVSSVRLGMGLQSQVIRWRNQIDAIQPQEDPMQDTESLDLDGVTGTWVDLKGRKESIVGLMVPQNDQLWVFKFRGASSDVSKHRAAFRTFCESVRIVSG